MNHSKFSSELFLTIVVIAALVSSSLISIPEINLVYSTSSFGQSLQQSQNELQSSSNKQVQQIITNTIDRINNSISNPSKIESNANHTQKTTSLPTFQHKVSILDNIALQKVRVGDIDIAYKQIGQGESILLISGSGHVMDVWPAHFLEELSKDYKVIFFDNRGLVTRLQGQSPFPLNNLLTTLKGL